MESSEETWKCPDKEEWCPEYVDMSWRCVPKGREFSSEKEGCLFSRLLQQAWLNAGCILMHPDEVVWGYGKEIEQNKNKWGSHKERCVRLVTSYDWHELTLGVFLPAPRRAVEQVQPWSCWIRVQSGAKRCVKKLVAGLRCARCFRWLGVEKLEIQYWTSLASNCAPHSSSRITVLNWLSLVGATRVLEIIRWLETWPLASCILK